MTASGLSKTMHASTPLSPLQCGKSYEKRTAVFFKHISMKFPQVTWLITLIAIDQTGRHRILEKGSRGVGVINKKTSQYSSYQPPLSEIYITHDLLMFVFSICLIFAHYSLNQTNHVSVIWC